MKKILILTLIFFASQYCDAQLLVKSTSQQFIEDAVMSGLFISEQSFQICDKETGELFGLNRKSEFGKQYSIGIKIPNGLLLNDVAVRPWMYDLKYGRYKDKYDPVFYQAKFAEMKEKAEFDSLAYSMTGMQELIDTTFYSFSSETFNGKGFALDYTKGEKDGWLVWIIADKNADISSMPKLDYSIYRKKLEIDKSKASFDVVHPEEKQNILGGIYVVPYYTEIGVIEFRLCGVIAKSKEGWKIHCPFVGMEDEISSEQKPMQEEEVKEEDGDASELTSVGKGKNKDKKKRKK